ncbi:MAG: S-layer protein [Candidatus Diapherotrites archaeon]|nr:S-layer protein [Candidatus Diapherotrites archaeon]
MKLVDGNKEMPVKRLPPEKLKYALQGFRWKILQELAKEPRYPAEIAKKFGIQEQKVYYHFKKLKEAGLVSLVRTEGKRGATAAYMKATDRAYAVLLDESWSPRKSQPGEVPDFLVDFYSKGMFNALVVVGSPDPHGPHEARARDTHYIGDLCLFLGSFSSAVEPCVRTDTEIRETELEENNLVLIGGPVVNMITARINDDLPIRMKIGERWGIYSTNTGETYYENVAFIVKIDSPWASDKKALVIAGASRGGTKAAILALLRRTKDIGKEPVYRIVKGLDRDGDGVIDSVKILE